LPASFRAGALLIEVVLCDDVLVEGTDEDHGDHPGEKEDDEERIDDREPVDLLLCSKRNED